MMRTEANSALANPSAVPFNDTEARPSKAPDETSEAPDKSGEHRRVHRASQVERRPLLSEGAASESAACTWDLGSAAAGDVDTRNIMGKTEAELSWALAASTPLAVLGATLLAHGTTLPSRLCVGLGLACVCAIGVLQIRVRMRVRGLFVEQAVAQGLPSSLGKQYARKYLNDWFR
jgi:hypothetical protein